MANIVTSQIRLPDSLNEYIQQEAERLGMPKNAVMLMLMDAGRRLLESPVIRKPE